MSLSARTKLGSYEVLAPLGAGGMGEVYRASDLKLRREVAIKILPAPFANDPSRLARFEREAQALAALNHPNIAAIYGLEHVDSVRFLVLELVEGPTLAEHLAAKRLEVAEALRIAAQIAEAVEAAHDKGIIHRDLKPANVKLTPDGRVKVLDFGLAKALGEPDPVDLAHSPTVTGGQTRAGIVLGTAGYMSPEQADGKAVDKRTDVWSYGVMLYEMLSGRRAFDGRTASHILVEVMEKEPDWSALPPLPGGVQEMLERCLQKEPAQRLRDIGDVRLLLQSAITRPVQVRTATASRPSRLRSGLAWASVALALIAIAAAAIVYLRPAVRAPDPVRFEIAQPQNTRATSAIRVSPDGHQVAFVTTGADNRRLIWVRTLETLEARPLDGTQGVGGGTLVWSPDSRSLAFVADRKLKRIDIAGGPAQTVVADLQNNSLLGGFWTKDNSIVFGNAGPVLQVSAAGGATHQLTKLDITGVHLAPSPLPDGRRFIYSAVTPAGPVGVYLATLDTSPENQNATRLSSDVSGVAEYVASPDSRGGHLLFVRFTQGTDVAIGVGGTLMAAPFDARTQAVGEARLIAEDVPALAFSSSDTGVLVYRSGRITEVASVIGAVGQLTWFDRQGRVLGTAGEPAFYSLGVKLSPDDTRVALTRPSDRNFDIWILEFARGTLTRLTSDPAPDVAPVWSPDGKRITFMSYRPDEKHGGLYEKGADNSGKEEPLITIGERIAPNEWSRDGRFLTYWTGGPTSGDLKLYIAGPERKVVPLLDSQFIERGGSFSPDGRWIAYASNETGQYEIYVRAFDPSSATATGAQTPVSTKGGTGAKWSRDGREIFYQALDGTIMTASVTTTPTFKAETPKALFKTAVVPFWDVTSDSQRFLIPVPQTEESAAASFKVVLNWTSTLAR